MRKEKTTKTSGQTSYAPGILQHIADPKSFQQRIFRSFLMIAAPIILVVCVVAFSLMIHSTHQVLQQTQATELEKVSAQLESIFSDTENMSRELIYNSVIQEYMTEASETDTYPEDSNAAYYINGLIANREYINSIVLTTQSRTILSTEQAYSDRSAFQNIQSKWWYGELTGGTISYQWFPYATLSADNYESQMKNEIPVQINTLLLARPIYSTDAAGSVLGYLMIYLDEEYMQDLWQDISWGKTTNVFLYNADYELIATNSSLVDYTDVLGDPSALTENTISRYENERYILSQTELTMNDWKICMVTPLNEVNSSSMLLLAAVIAIIAGIVFALFFMTRYTVRSIARPIMRLSEIMDSYHVVEAEPGTETILFYQNRSDEIGQMYRSYKRMGDRMNSLIQEIYVKNLEKKDAELALLQSQINPHFLYNTLDSINWIAMANDQDEISEMITALSDTFRLSLMKESSSFGELEHEVQYIQSYLVLQKFRYSDRLQYEIEVPDPLPALFIPRFILQPIVENALKHGIDSFDEGGRILIRLKVKEEEVILYVINDGTQIDLKQMDSLLAFNPEDSDLLNFKNGSYGVQNINRRIKVICGEQYGIHYTTTDRQTICTIILPVKETL